MKIDLRPELAKNQTLAQLRAGEEAKEEVKVDAGFKMVKEGQEVILENLNDYLIDPDIRLDRISSKDRDMQIIFDGKYIYIDIICEGVFKYVKSSSKGILKGLFYDENKELNRRWERTYANIDGNIYCRDESIEDQKALILLNTSTLELEYTSEMEATFERAKRTEEDHFNKPIYEVSELPNSSDLPQGLDNYRICNGAHIFSDGIHLCMITIIADTKNASFDLCLE